MPMVRYRPRCFQQDSRQLRAVQQHIIRPFQRKGIGRPVRNQRVMQRERGHKGIKRGLRRRHLRAKQIACRKIARRVMPRPPAPPAPGGLAQREYPFRAREPPRGARPLHWCCRLPAGQPARPLRASYRTSASAASAAIPSMPNRLITPSTMIAADATSSVPAPARARCPAVLYRPRNTCRTRCGCSRTPR